MSAFTIINLKVEKNSEIYEGCKIEEVGGRPVLQNSMDSKTLNNIGKNIQNVIEEYAKPSHYRCILTGPAPIQIYLIAFHLVVHRFSRIEYTDGKNASVIIARH